MRLVLSPTTIGNVCILHGQCVKLTVTLLSGESLTVRKVSIPELMKCSMLPSKNVILQETGAVSCFSLKVILKLVLKRSC
jgi:hypothetical protein